MTHDPRVLSRVRHLHLRARVLTDSLLMGEHRSRRIGQAVEFADYLPYIPGMDLRGLDWKVWGRTDKLVVKRFHTETQLPSVVLVDLSGDIGTGSTGTAGYPELDTSKAGYAITLAATLLYWLYRHNEPVGLEIIGGLDVPYRSYLPRGGRNHLQALFVALAQARPGGVASLDQALRRIGDRVVRRGLVAVITDGMEEPSTWLPSLGAFARRGSDLRLFHLYDRGEWGLRFPGALQLYSPEGGGELAVDPDGAREAFAEVVKDYVAEVRRGIVGWGGLHHLCPTDRPLEDVLRMVSTGRDVALEPS